MRGGFVGDFRWKWENARTCAFFPKLLVFTPVSTIGAGKNYNAVSSTMVQQPMLLWGLRGCFGYGFLHFERKRACVTRFVENCLFATKLVYVGTREHSTLHVCITLRLSFELHGVAAKKRFVSGCFYPIRLRCAYVLQRYGFIKRGLFITKLAHSKQW